MRKGYKVVCNTAAGRSRYMKLLIPHVLSSQIVDRYDLWVNTMNEQDLRFFELLSKRYSKINLVYIKDGKYNGLKSLFSFYKYSMEENTIYVKLDDDIIWMEPDSIQKMVDFRIENPEYFIVSPLVINNASGAYILQSENKIRFKDYLPASMSWASAWCDGKSAYNILEWFHKKIMDSTYIKLHSGKKPIAMQRFSINMILWFGEDFQKFNGDIEWDDEEELSVSRPLQYGRANCINADTIITHFAFNKQREYLDSTSILQNYERLIEQGFCGKEVKELYNNIKGLIIESAHNYNIVIPTYINEAEMNLKEQGFLESLRYRINHKVMFYNIPNTLYTIDRLLKRLKENSIILVE